MPTWSTAADFEGYQSESGVRHQALGDFTATEVAMGPVGKDFIAMLNVEANSDKAFARYGRAEGWIGYCRNNSVRDAASNRTYIGYQGRNGPLNPQILYYDHIADEYGPEYQVGVNPLTSDDHGAPSVAVDTNGYIHVTWGTHGSAAKYAISTNANDISAWTAQTDATTSGSYEHLIFVNGSLYLFYRRDVVSGSHENLSYRKAATWATGHTWSADVDLIDTGNRVYPGEFVVSGTDIYIACWDRTNSAEIYVARFDTTTDTLYNLAGTAQTVPLNKTNADANLGVDGGVGTDKVGAPSFALDASNRPLLAYNYYDGTNVYSKYTAWNGTSWSTALTFNSVVSAATGTFRSMQVVRKGTTVYVYQALNGNIERWLVGASVALDATLYTPSNTVRGYNLSGILAPRNAASPIDLIFEDVNQGNYTIDLNMYAYDTTAGKTVPRFRVWEYTMEENAGTAIAVSDPKLSGGTMQGTPTYNVTGLNGASAIQFNGTDSKIIVTPSAATYNEDSAQLRGLMQGSSYAYRQGTFATFGKDISPGGVLATVGRLFGSISFRIGINLSSGMYIVPGTATGLNGTSGLVLTGWHLYVVTMDASRLCSFRQDKTAVGSGTLANSAVNQGDNELCIGAWQNSSTTSTSYGNYLNGTVKWMRFIPNYLMPSTESDALYDALLAATYTSGMQAL